MIINFIKCFVICLSLNSFGVGKEIITASISRIIDGDTVEVFRGSEKVKIRLYGIDAPERAQDYGNSATRALQEALKPYDEIDVVIRDKDRYGRVVGEIFAGGSNINLIMLLEGHCWHYERYSKDKHYKRAQLLAKKENLGLWRYPNPIPPWEFRSDL